VRRTLASFALAALAACGSRTPSDREFCEQREAAYDRAYPNETNNLDHGERVDMCTRGVAEEHGSDVDANGNDIFKRRLACAKHLGEQPPLAAWEAMKDCESRTLFLD
jgi:hypothetical protein